MAKRFPIRTAIAGLTTFAMVAPVIAPTHNTILSAPFAFAAEAVTVTGADEIKIGASATFTATVPNAQGGQVQFYLDGVAIDGPVDLTGETAAKEITSRSYTSGDFKHTVTARYIDGKGFNPNPDGTATFTTPVDIKPKQTDNGTDSDVYNNFKVGPNANTLADSSLDNPVVIEAGSQYTISGNMRINGGSSRVYEVGFNPPAGSAYVDGSMLRIGELFKVTTLGDGNGGIRKLDSSLRDDYYPNWGKPGYTKVNAGYVGQQHTETYTAGNGTNFNLQASFVAPETPGVYVPQMTSYKYRNSTHILQRMDDAAFLVPAKELPKRNTGITETTLTFDSASTTSAQDDEIATITATVTPEAEGTVSFFKDEQQLNDAPISVKGGKATLAQSFPAGTHEISAKFTPADAAVFDASETTATHTLTVTEAPVQNNEVKTQTTLEVPAEGKEGEKVTLKATVTADNQAAVEGQVRFVVNGTALDTAVTIQNGTATAEYTFAQAGPNQVVAQYLPADPNFRNSVSKTSTINIAPQPREAQVSVTSGQTFVSGEGSDLTARVSPVDAQGEVEFWDNDPKTGERRSVTAKVVNGTAVLKDIRFIEPLGERTVNVNFLPAEGSPYAAAENTGKVTVVKKAEPKDPQISIEKPTDVIANQEVELVATLAEKNVPGEVKLFNGETEIQNVSYDPATGRATAKTTFADAGIYEVRAEFTPAGDQKADYLGSTARVAVPVKADADSEAPAVPETKTEISKLPENVTDGDDATIEVTVTDANDPDATPEGDVELYDGDELLWTAKVVDGVATFSGPAVVGEYNLTAKFVPLEVTKNAASTSDAKKLVVQAKVTTPTVTVTAPAGEKTTDDDVTLTAKVAPASAGTVEFFNGDTKIDGTVAYDPATGEATLTTKLAEGDYTITAKFTPDTDNTTAKEATSAAAPKFTVTKKTDNTQQPPANEATAPTVTVTAPAGEKTTDDEVTLTAKVDPASAGTVEFFNGEKSLGTAAVNNGTATLTTKLAEGDYTITAKFTPASDNTTAKEATSEAAPKFTVTNKTDNTQQPPAQEATAPTVTVTAPAGEKTTDDEVTLTAKVDPASAGTVEFFNGDTKIDGTVAYDPATGEATLTTKLPAGANAITAKFTPAAGNTTAKEATSQVTEVNVTEKTDEQPNQPNPNQPNPNPAPAFTPEVKNETRTTTEGATLPAPSAVLSNASQILPGSVLYWSKLPTVADPVGEITVINPDGTTATAKVPFTVTGKTDTTNGNSSEGSSQSSEGSSLSRPAIIGISVTAVVLLLGLLGFGLANNQQFKDFIYTQFGIRL